MQAQPVWTLDRTDSELTWFYRYLQRGLGCDFGGSYMNKEEQINKYNRNPFKIDMSLTCNISALTFDIMIKVYKGNCNFPFSHCLIHLFHYLLQT